jgi:flagellar basal body rod protein FlgG
MVAPDGQVSAVAAGGAQVTALGRVELVRFANPGGLAQQGDNLAGATPASGEPLPGGGSLVFGAVEDSNVELAGEMVGLIVSRASVRANLAALKAQDEVLGEVIDLRG